MDAFPCPPQPLAPMQIPEASSNFFITSKRETCKASLFNIPIKISMNGPARLSQAYNVFKRFYISDHCNWAD